MSSTPESRANRRTVRLGDIGQTLIGLTYSPDQVRDSGTLVLRSSNIQNDSLSFDDNVYVDADIPSRIRVQQDDLLICVRNGSRSLIGKSVLLDGRVTGQTFGAFMSVFRSPDNKFVSQCFRSDLIKRQIEAHLGATINQITNASLNSFCIPWPSPEERAVISNVLSDVDRQISALERLIAKKHWIKQGMMQRLLTGATRLGGFTRPWTVLAVPDLLTRVNAKKHQITTNSYRSIGRIPIVDQGKRPVVGYTNDESLRLRASTDGVIVFGDHTCIVKYVDFDFVVGADGTQILRGRPGHSTRFLAYALALRPIVSTGYNRHFKFLKELEFPVPGEDEQSAIAAVLADADREIYMLQSRLAKLQALKQGMAQELLAGSTVLALEIVR